jgi:nitrate reductase NapE component
LIGHQLEQQVASERFRIWKAGLALVVLAKITLAAMTPLAGDFLNWVSMGAAVLSGQYYLGVYTGPAYVYAGTIALWRVLVGNTNALQNLFYAYYLGPIVYGPQIWPEIYLFTLCMKIPLLVTDIASMLLVMRIVQSRTGSESKSLIAGFLLAASPLVFLSEMFSTADIYSGSLILLGAYMTYLAKTKIGSFSLAIGTILRFSPLLVTWVYVLAFARERKGKSLLSFVAVQLAVFGSLAVAIVAFYGFNVFFELFSSGAPGILVPEALIAMGPFLVAGIPHNPYALGISLVSYFMVGYLITKPSCWAARSVGSEAICIFAVYYAFLDFFPQFLMWILPLLVVHALLSRFGIFHYLAITVVGTLTVLFRSSDYFAAYGKGVLFIPNWNSAMAYLSASMYGLRTLFVVRGMLDSIFSALMLVLIFWILVDSRKNRLRSSIPQKLTG